MRRVALGLVLLAVAVTAQEPNYLGQLLIEPSVDSTKCITASSQADGAPVVIQPCTGAQSQQWTFTGGNVKVFGTFCLDVTNGVKADGTKLQIWTCSAGNPNQQWSWGKWDNHISWSGQGSEQCLDLTNGNLADGNQLQTWDCTPGNLNQAWNVGYGLSALPYQSEAGQYGYNNCGLGTSQTSNCQTAWINSAEDFCLWAPPNPNGAIGDTERIEVAWCTKSGRGARTIPDGTLKGVHFVQTPDYVQVTGVGDFTKINVKAGDAGGELDPHGADANGNPIGGLVYGSTFAPNMQYHEWTSFISSGEFCFRACKGPQAATLCQHIYDVMGCYWNMPANYDAGVFENCKGDDDLPMGVYGTSTWYQGVSPTPPAHPAAPSSSCTPLPTISVSPLQRRRVDRFEYVRSPPEPTSV